MDNVINALWKDIDDLQEWREELRRRHEKLKVETQEREQAEERALLAIDNRIKQHLEQIAQILKKENE
jgi:hypothetical protein